MKKKFSDRQIEFLAGVAFIVFMIAVMCCAGCSGYSSLPPKAQGDQRDMSVPFQMSMHVFANPTTAAPAVTVNYAIKFSLTLTGHSMDKTVHDTFTPDMPGIPSVYTTTFEALTPWTNYEMTLLVTGPPERAGATLTEKFITHDVFGPQPDLGDNDSGQ